MTSWMRDDPSKMGPSNEDYLLGKTVDKNFEQQGTMGQINAVEYGTFVSIKKIWTYWLYTLIDLGLSRCL